MTTQKSFKSRVRTRMEKTGESYTSARRQLIDKAGRDTEGMAAAAAAPGVRAHRLPDDVIREHTGHGWDEWLRKLDEWGAAERSHTEIARWLVQDQNVPGWYAQSITVTYEQVRGMRAPGQNANGYFNVSASRTIDVTAEEIFEAFADESIRQQWLPGASLRVTTSKSPKSFRAQWEGGASRLIVSCIPKDGSRATVHVAHEKLPDAEAASQYKSFWRERLGILKKLLEA